MRSGLAFLFLVALLASGCLSGPAPEPAPRATLWPPEGGIVAGVGAPDPSCAAWPCQIRDRRLPGMGLDASFTEGDGWHRLDLTAFNDGDRSYWLNSACVFHPWAEGLIDKEGQQLQAREEPPPDHHPDGCNECNVVEFAPGGLLHRSAVFNETFWHRDGYAVAARPGTYTWSLGIMLSSDAGCKGDGGSLGVSVLVTVPEEAA